MKPLFIKKNGTVSKVSGIIMNLIPSYTMAEYNALTHKPLLWVRTDEEYAQIPSEDVSYGSGSVKDALDGLNTLTTKKSYTCTTSAHTGSDPFTGHTVSTNCSVSTYGRIVVATVDFTVTDANVTTTSWSNNPIVDITDWDLGNISWLYGGVAMDTNGQFIGFLSINDGQLGVTTVKAVTITKSVHVCGQLVIIK